MKNRINSLFRRVIRPQRLLRSAVVQSTRLFKTRQANDPPYTRELINALYRENIGEYTYGLPQIRSWGEGTTLKMGKFCCIADNVTIFLGGNHRTDWITTYPFPAIESWRDASEIKGHPATKGDVIIGNDVWIGSHATILSGIKIGDGAVIGAFSVVTNDVDPYSIVAGNPAKLVRKRFDEETVNKLLLVRWWDWPAEKVRKNLRYLCSSQIDFFLNETHVD